MTYSLALAPSAASWQGPQRLLLKVDGEQIADVEYRPPDASTGLNTPLDVLPALRAAARSCASCGLAHALALCQAVEALAGIAPPPRAAMLRCVAAELERAVSHLGTLAGLFETLGLRQAAAGFAELASQARSALALAAGPAPAELLYPGGLSRDLADEARGELAPALGGLSRRLFQMADRVIDRRALLARTVETGALSREATEQFGLRGPMARAAGLAVDARIDRPYAAYAELRPELVTQDGGDVYARLVLLLLEALESVKLADRGIQQLPAGALQADVPRQLPAGQATGEVEAPRGALRYHVTSDGRRLTEIGVEPPPQLDRLLARALLGRAMLDDVLLIALSTDPCSACAAARSYGAL